MLSEGKTLHRIGRYGENSCDISALGVLTHSNTEQRTGTESSPPPPTISLATVPQSSSHCMRCQLKGTNVRNVGLCKSLDCFAQSPRTPLPQGNCINNDRVPTNNVTPEIRILGGLYRRSAQSRTSTRRR